MGRYLIETKHEPKDCRRVVTDIYAAGYLHHFDWGCEAGVHCGWAIIEAESTDQAIMAVPRLLRDKARVIGLNKYSVNKDGELHGT